MIFPQEINEGGRLIILQLFSDLLPPVTAVHWKTQCFHYNWERRAATSGISAAAIGDLQTGRGPTTETICLNSIKRETVKRKHVNKEEQVKK